MVFDSTIYQHYQPFDNIVSNVSLGYDYHVD